MDLKGGKVKMQSALINENGIVKVKLNTITEVKDFVCLAESLEGEVSVNSGYYTVNGKSIMGILSLALNDMLNVKIFNEGDRDKFVQGLNERKITYGFLKEGLVNEE